jgi:hypothetical protein
MFMLSICEYIVFNKSSLPPVQKVGLVLFSGVAGAVIQTGANAINAQRFAAGSMYFSWEIYENLSSYVDVYLKSRNK